MGTIKMEATADTPEVLCNSDGTVSLKGRSLAEDTVSFYRPIMDWVSNIHAETLTLNIQLEYMNTASSKQIYSLLELAKENPWKKNIKIKWFFDVNDDEAYELGKEFEAMLELPFEYYNFG